MLGGQLVFHFVNVIVMTALVAPLVLWRYRRAVLAGMQDKLGAPLPLAAPRRRGERAPAAAGVDVAAALAWEARLRRRIFAVALVAAFVPSLLLSLLHYLIEGEPFTTVEVFLDAAVPTLVAVPICALLTAMPRWRALRLAVCTLAALAGATVLLAVVLHLAAGKAPTLDVAMNFVRFVEVATFLLVPPALVGLVIGARRVRGVAPLAFAALLVFALAPLLGLSVTQWLTGMRWSAGWVLSGPGLDAGIIVLALPMGLLAWWRLKALARAYELKRFSDAQLLAHSWWLVLVAFEAITLISVHAGAGNLLKVLAASAVAYALLPFLLAHGLRWAQRGAPAPPPRTLLLLRVFGDSARTAALFERIATRWQRFGPVTMIAAPDVVAGTVDPGDVLRFATGNLAASFVTSQADLTRRLATMDGAPDADGRYRMNEFCCHDDTWQATVVELIERADAVVMDLRGFSAQRHGCEFELKELATRLNASRVVVIVDASTDRALLAQLAPAGAASMRIAEVARGSGRQADAAFATLLAAAA
jgi:hypothetical protein